MSRAVRFAVFALGAAGAAVLVVAAYFRVPEFGSAFHPYRDLAVRAAVEHRTANAVSSVNFDQRALDTLGEELIFLGSVVGATALLRPLRAEHARSREQELAVPVLPLTALAGYVLTPVVLLLGADMLVHGHLTPGGGFQSGVVLATGMHLLYIAGDLPALRRLRPLAWSYYAEALGAGAFVAIGIVGSAVGLAFLANVVPLGTFGDLLSGGAVPLLSFAVGCEVVAGVIVLVAQFLHQTHDLTTDSGRRR